MRCFMLALAAQARGHTVEFVSAALTDALQARLSTAGVTIRHLTVPNTVPHQTTAHWRLLPQEKDAQATSQHLHGADWLVLDHYGLGGEWVQQIRAAHPELRILAMADLDEEPLFADLLLDYAHTRPRPRQHPYLALMGGAKDALLHPDFSALRPQELARHHEPVKKVLILPGMMDPGGLAPAALAALDDWPDLAAEVIMSRDSQSLARVRDMLATRPQHRLTLDATDMAARMAQADLCIGAGGGTNWERCCLGLPSVVIPVAENQRPGVEALAEAGAILALDPGTLQHPDAISAGLGELIAKRHRISEQATRLVDGMGANRVLSAMEGQFRPVRAADAQLLFDWRSQPRIRQASLNSAPLVWAEHRAYIERIANGDPDGLWLIYSEGGEDMGHINARRQSGDIWHWSFYKGAEEAPKGAGRRMLAAFLHQMALRPDVCGISADVMAENTASVKLHEALGFAQTGTRDRGTVLEFSLSRCDMRTRLGLPDEGKAP